MISSVAADVHVRPDNGLRTQCSHSADRAGRLPWHWAAGPAHHPPGRAGRRCRHRGHHTQWSSAMLGRGVLSAYAGPGPA